MRKLKWLNHSDLAIRKTATVGRDEYLDCMTFKRAGRPLFTEIFGPLIGLKEEWEEQGATPAELDFSAFRYRCETRAHIPVRTGLFGGHPEQIIEENEEHKIWRDSLGRTMKLQKGVSTIGMPQDHPVANMDDWLKIKPWYQFSEKRLAPGWEAIARQHSKDDKVVCVSIPGGFDEPRKLLGEELLCIAYYEQPELVRDILQTIAKTAFRVLEQVSATVRIDLLSVHEDMAGKSGPLAGPTQIREFIMPYFRPIWDMLSERGARLFDMDSDGDINPILEELIECGINCVHPMEPAAGMDIVKTRKKFGARLAFYGGIDKYVLARSKSEIISELEYKLPPMIKTGGCALGLDHRVPNGTPLENYRFYVNKVWEIIERESVKTN